MHHSNSSLRYWRKERRRAREESTAVPLLVCFSSSTFTCYIGQERAEAVTVMSCKQDHKLLTELSVSGRQLNWSKEIFAAKFNAAYKEIRDGEFFFSVSFLLFVNEGRRQMHKRRMQCAVYFISVYFTCYLFIFF